MKLRVGKHVYKLYDGNHRRIIYTIAAWNSCGVMLYYIDEDGHQQESYSSADNLVEADPFEEPFACAIDDLHLLYDKAREGGPLEQRRLITSLNKFLVQYRKENSNG